MRVCRLTAEWCGGAQDGKTPMYVGCEKGHFEVVKLLLTGTKVDVNQANKVRVGGEGEGELRERAGRSGRVRCRVWCVSWRRAAGAHISREAIAGVREHQHWLVGLFMGMEAVPWVEGGAGG